MFLDTNVLVYARIDTAPGHEAARRRMREARRNGEALCVSRQVLREYLATVTRGQTWSAPIPAVEALGDITRIEREFRILEDGPRVTETLKALCAAIRVGGRQIHDANIAATMIAHGERRILTFNARDFRRYSEWIDVIDPGRADE